MYDLILNMLCDYSDELTEQKKPFDKAVVQECIRRMHSVYDKYLIEKKKTRIPDGDRIKAEFKLIKGIKCFKRNGDYSYEIEQYVAYCDSDIVKWLVDRSNRLDNVNNLLIKTQQRNNELEIEVAKLKRDDEKQDSYKISELKKNQAEWKAQMMDRIHQLNGEVMVLKEQKTALNRRITSLEKLLEKENKA